MQDHGHGTDLSAGALELDPAPSELLNRALALAESGDLPAAERALLRARDMAGARGDTSTASTAGIGLQLCRALAAFDEATAELDRAFNRTLALRQAEREALSRGLTGVLGSALEGVSAGAAAAVLSGGSRLPFALGIVELRPSSRLRSRERELRVRLLGGFEVSLDGAPVPRWRSTRASHVFAYLALHWRQPVSRHQLMGLFWPDHSEERAQNNLSLAIMTVRRTLAGQAPGAEDLIRSSDGAYRIDSMRVTVDVDEFLESLGRASSLEASGREAEAAEALDQAIGLYGGDFLPSGLYEDWTFDRRQHLHDSFLEALSRRARLARRFGDYGGAIEANRRLLQSDAANEDAHRELMLDYLKTGQRGRALRQVQLCRDALERHLGVEPGPRTLEAMSLVLRQST